jgi:hypothetical protein
MTTIEKNAVAEIRRFLEVSRLDPRRLFLCDDGQYCWIGDRAELTAEDAWTLGDLDDASEEEYAAICGRLRPLAVVSGHGVVRWEDLPESWRDGSALGPIAPLIKATISENGNGLPNIGELCYDADTDTVYKVAGWYGSLSGNIRTNGPGCGNSIDALLVERGSSSDTTEEEWEAIESSNYGVSVETGDDE